MVNEMTIGLKEFSKLPRDERIEALFQNTIEIKELVKQNAQKFQEHEKKDWFHQKINYISLFILAAVLGITKFVAPLFS